MKEKTLFDNFGGVSRRGRRGASGGGVKERWREEEEKSCINFSNWKKEEEGEGEGKKKEEELKKAEEEREGRVKVEERAGQEQEEEGCHQMSRLPRSCSLCRCVGWRSVRGPSKLTIYQ